jgi:hypothetical protein
VSWGTPSFRWLCPMTGSLQFLFFVISIQYPLVGHARAFYWHACHFDINRNIHYIDFLWALVCLGKLSILESEYDKHEYL